MHNRRSHQPSFSTASALATFAKAVVSYLALSSFMFGDSATAKFAGVKIDGLPYPLVTGSLNNPVNGGERHFSVPKQEKPRARRRHGYAHTGL